jgi:hypothetical protein
MNLSAQFLKKVFSSQTYFKKKTEMNGQQILSFKTNYNPKSLLQVILKRLSLFPYNRPMPSNECFGRLSLCINLTSGGE